MSPKTSGRFRTSGAKTWRELLTPGRVIMGALLVLALIFIFENTRSTEIRLIVPLVTIPLWVALLATGVIGAGCGAYFMRRR